MRTLQYYLAEIIIVQNFIKIKKLTCLLILEKYKEIIK